ncbi:MAG: sulfatase [Anaerolineales bacterium]|nr:sulfatase [Anaerolineales bacterium]
MPNLIMIDCHDLGQHLGAYGWKTVPSENLDGLAARGVRFENSFCTAPQCSPSRAALYTGRYAHANGMFGLAHSPFNWRMHPGEKHLAQYLRDAGYTTALIGVQHVTVHQVEEIQALGFQQVWQEESPPKVAGQVEAYLKQKPEKPFFLSIGFMSPHRDRQGLFKQAPPDSHLGVEVPPYLPQTPEARHEFSELQGVIQEMDAAVGRIWTTLVDLDLLDDTWVIFTTDHGLAMPRAKCTLYDPGIRTALIMYARPFGLVGGQTYTELISNVDLLPTILEMLGLVVPEQIQGQSFAKLLRQEAYQRREKLFAEKTFHTAYEPQRAIRTHRYKLIWNVEAGIINVPGDVMRSPIFPQVIQEVVVERPPFELYDLRNDPLESDNVIDKPEFFPIGADLKAQLYQWMQETGDPILKGPVGSPFYYASLEALKQGLPAGQG